MTYTINGDYLRVLKKWVFRLEMTYWQWVVLVISVLLMMGSRKILDKEFLVIIVLIVLSILPALRYESWMIHNKRCPFGAILTRVGRKSLFKTHVDTNKCVGCKKCEKVCPADAIAYNNKDM